MGHIQLETELHVYNRLMRSIAKKWAWNKRIRYSQFRLVCVKLPGSWQNHIWFHTWTFDKCVVQFVSSSTLYVLKSWDELISCLYMQRLRAPVQKTSSRCSPTTALSCTVGGNKAACFDRSHNWLGLWCLLVVCIFGFQTHQKKFNTKNKPEFLHVNLRVQHH